MSHLARCLLRDTPEVCHSYSAPDYSGVSTETEGATDSLVSY